MSVLRRFMPLAALACLAGCGGGGGGSTLPVPGTSVAATATPVATSAPAPAPTSTVVISSANGPCQFQTANQPLQAAFCETFSAPAPIGNRSGPLDGTLWGVSRQTGLYNWGQGWANAVAPTVLDACGQSSQVYPDKDIAVCNGMVFESVNDDTSVTSLAMYPKQPFDIAGRTGTVTFDVSDDTTGSHTVWPELWYSDQPVPDPFTHFSSWQSVPVNGFGLRIESSCPANSGGGCGIRQYCPEQPESSAIVTVGSAVVVNNYVANDSAFGGNVLVKDLDCVKASTGPGNNNHFEVRFSQKEVDVYGTDAGTTAPLRHLAVITNMSLTLTRGLLWIEDVHYNADKEGAMDQRIHTFSWTNIGFDGPILARDLAFDVADSLMMTNSAQFPDTQPDSAMQIPGNLLNLGYSWFPNTPPLALTVPGVYNIGNANGAFLTLNAFTQDPVTLNYQINNGAWQSFVWPFPTCSAQGATSACAQVTMALPVSLSDIQAGTNTIQLNASDAISFSNVDLILRGAAGVPPAPVTTSSHHGLNPASTRTRSGLH
jgi:hypothetical protein